jgi:hypothetical protein
MNRGLPQRAQRRQTAKLYSKIKWGEQLQIPATIPPPQGWKELSVPIRGHMNNRAFLNVILKRKIRALVPRIDLSSDRLQPVTC